MSKATRIKQAIRITVISTLVFYFGLIALLNLPAVQHRISTYAARELTRLTQAEVSIGNVDLGLLNRVVIQNVQIKDWQKKDMLGISRFSVKIDIPSLLRGKIRISSVQLFGLDARLNRAHPKAPLNCQFLIDTFASKDTTKSEKSIDLRINSVLIRRGQIHYDVLSESNTPHRFNPHHIGISELSATISLKALQTDSLNAQIRRMSFNEQSGFQLKKFALKATATPKGIHLHDLNLSLPTTTVNIDTFTVAGELTAPDFISDTQTTYMGRLNASVTPADITCFVPALQHFQDSVHIDLAFHGRGKQARCTNFYLSSPHKALEIHAEGMLDHSNPSQPPYFFGQITQADADKTAISWLIHNLKGTAAPVPDILQRLGFLKFQGDVSGYPSRITAHGTLQSQPGQINANLTMHTDTLTQQKSYSGKVSTHNFELGKLLAKKELGKTSFDLELNGLQYRNHQPESHIKGEISSLEYNDYQYQHIALNGNFKPGGFNGHLSLDDENGKISVDGNFVTQQAVPDFNLRLEEDVLHHVEAPARFGRHRHGVRVIVARRAEVRHSSAWSMAVLELTKELTKVNGTMLNAQDKDHRCGAETFFSPIPVSGLPHCAATVLQKRLRPRRKRMALSSPMCAWFMSIWRHFSCSGRRASVPVWPSSASQFSGA